MNRFQIVVEQGTGSPGMIGATVIFYFFLILVSFSLIRAEDWPTYQHDNQRSSMTQENLKLPLHEEWHYRAKQPPQPAWPPPAVTDYWHREQNLLPRVIYDRAFHVVAAGDAVYFGSSANDKIYCLDADTGKERWSFFAEGPIRLAPTIFDGRVYVGADDGCVYCLNGTDGSLDWKFTAASNQRIVPGNERIISICPVRTGVLVQNNIAYCCAGFFPGEGVTLYALDARNGTPIWRQELTDVAPQGYILASLSSLYVPTGRTTPVAFKISNGEKLGTFSGNGGTFALLHNNTLIYGGGDLGELEIRQPDSEDPIVTFSGSQIIVKDDRSFLRSGKEISAINRNSHQNTYKNRQKISENLKELTDKLWDLREKRKLLKSQKPLKALEKQIDQTVEKISHVNEKLQALESGGLLWRVPRPETYSMILAGSVLFVGGDAKVEALRISDGQELWSASVSGKAYGLTVANGRLIVSTDRGSIHSFSENNRKLTDTIGPFVRPSPYPEDGLTKIYTAAAEQILKETGIETGYCLVIGSGEGRLAFELAKRTGLTMIGIEADAEKVAVARRKLDLAGIYGTRVSLRHGTLADLSFSSYFANLIVSDAALISGIIPAAPDDVFRVLRPYGGVAYLGQITGSTNFFKNWLQNASNSAWKMVNQNGTWAMARRGKVPGSGEWTHLYADAANTACSMDQLRAPVQIQWFGRPGPRDIINRHSRPMSPLFKNGRLFIPADNRIITVDAYNGTALWELEVPKSRRLGALKDCGQMALTEEYIYIVTQDECWAVDVATGKPVKIFKVPQLIAQDKREWGYLATVSDQIFGSGKKVGASFYELGRFNSDELEGDFREMITSDYLFSLDRHSGQVLWTYQNGIFFNNTIAIGADHLYLIESRNLKARSDTDGRLRVDKFCAGATYISKLAPGSGTRTWEKPFLFPFQQIMYLSYARGMLLVVGSYNVGKHVHYGLFAFDAETGDLTWKNSYQGDKIGGEHGEQWQHPVIIGSKIIQRPYEFDLKTGKKSDYYLDRGGHGCGGLSGSAYYLYGRGGNPRMYEIINGKVSGTPLTRVNRPGCWINIIAAGGLILLPESSSGCTCDYPVQTSFAFAPVIDVN